MSFFRQLYLIITGQIEELSVEWEHLENPKKIGIVESCDVLNLKNSQLFVIVKMIVLLIHQTDLFMLMTNVFTWM